MIKPIAIPQIGRRFIATTMLTTALVAANSTKINAQSNIDQNVQTELVSKDTAKALEAQNAKLKVNRIEQNQKLNRIYIKYCEKDKTIKSKKESLESIYKVYGTFGGSIEIQRIIDNDYIEKTFNSYIEHLNYFRHNRKISNEIFSKFKEWRNNVYYNRLWQEEIKMYEKDNIPSADKVLSVIDNHINNTEFFTEEDKKLYEEGTRYFKSQQKDTTSVSAKSDLIAFKTHVLNAIAFKNYFIEQKSMPDDYIFMYYLNYDFLNGDIKIKP